MGIDDFKEEADKIDVEQSEIKISAGPRDWTGNSAMADEAEIEIGGLELIIELDDFYEWYPCEDKNNSEFISATIFQLAKERLEKLANTDLSRIDIEEDSFEFKLLVVLASKSVCTRTELDDLMNKPVEYRHVKGLEDKDLIDRVGKDGQAILWNVTTKGYSLILKHVEHHHITDRAYEYIVEDQSIGEVSEKQDDEAVEVEAEDISDDAKLEDFD